LLAFAPLADDLAARGAVGLIHHPTALETGRDDAARDALLAIERALFPRLRRVVVTSTDTRKRLVAEFDVPASRIVVVEPGTPPAPRSPGPTLDGCAILSVATLLPRKGHDVLMRALSRLPDLDWRLVVAGGAPDPAYGARLRDMAVELGIAERVAFVGEVAPADLAPLWDAAGFFALATWYEGYGMAIAEALRRGLPVAVTSGGAAAALVVPECGVVCPPGDHAGLSRAMRRLIFDRPLRLSMADAAWRIGGGLPDWTAQGARFIDALGA
jgi:glycosyltransferase involved in cell wall biosynthesis